MQAPDVRPTAETLPFWESCSRGELKYQFCADCCTPQFPPSTVCTHCHSGKIEWRVSKGEGKIHSHTVVERAPLPVFKDRTPYVIALVDFAEGFRMMMNVQTSQPYDIQIGMPVSVVFEERGGFSLPQAKQSPART